MISQGHGQPLEGGLLGVGEWPFELWTVTFFSRRVLQTGWSQMVAGSEVG